MVPGCYTWGMYLYSVIMLACLLPKPALAAASRRLSNALQACSAAPPNPAALEVGCWLKGMHRDHCVIG